MKESTGVLRAAGEGRLCLSCGVAVAFGLSIDRNTSGVNFSARSFGHSVVASFCYGLKAKVV